MKKSDDQKGKIIENQERRNTRELKAFIANLGIDLVGIAEVSKLHGMPMGVPTVSSNFEEKYRHAIVLGMPLDGLGPDTPGRETSFFLEKAAFEIMAHIEGEGHRSMIVHTEEEFDPVKRMGLMSLKVLAKGAGIGWQGRSLLIVSPEHGPLHRLVAILTAMPLKGNEPIRNQCGDCSSCIDACPVGALTLTAFDDHPEKREDVLDIAVCLGDDSCTACIEACPWTRSNEPVQPFSAG